MGRGWQCRVRVPVRTIVVEDKGRLSAGRTARARTHTGLIHTDTRAGLHNVAFRDYCRAIILILYEQFSFSSILTACSADNAIGHVRRGSYIALSTVPEAARMITIIKRPDKSGPLCAFETTGNAARRVRRPAPKPIDNAHNLDPIGLLISVAISNNA